MCVHYTLAETLPRLADQHLLKFSARKCFGENSQVFTSICFQRFYLAKKKNLTSFTLLSLHSFYWNVLTDDSMWPAEGSVMLSYKRPAYPLSRWWAGTINNHVKYLRGPLAVLASQPSFSLCRWGRIRSFIEFLPNSVGSLPSTCCDICWRRENRSSRRFCCSPANRVVQHKNTMIMSF